MLAILAIALVVGGAYVDHFFASDLGLARNQGMLRLVLLGSASGLGIAAVLLLLAERWARSESRALTDAASRLAAGKLTARVRAAGSAPLGRFGVLLNTLAVNFRASLDAVTSERDLLRRVLEGMGEGVLVVDEGGRIALANPALREALLLGSEVHGKTPLELVRNVHLKETLDAAARSPGSAASCELELGDLKPRRFHVHATAVHGKPGGVLAVFVDVTDIRRLETMRRDFVSNVSHELRTPVAAIASAAETLQVARSSGAEVTQEFLEIIVRNSERLGQLIDDLLDLSRIESREYHLVAEPIVVREATQHVLGLFSERAERRGIKLALVLPEGVIAVSADRRALEQVLTNLIDNAVKYCNPSTTVQIRATLSGATVAISVEDEGPGIEARHRDRLFERFYRVDESRSREVGGTGLGLSIVKNLAEAMGGQVQLSSRFGGGSTFTVVLPRA